jgi:hypothetical protein
MYKDYPHRKDIVKIVHNIQEATTVKDMGRIYAYLNDRQVEYQSNMIKVEGKIINQLVAILIDSGESHCYIDPKIVDILHLEKSKLGKESLVQLATETKRRIHDMVRSCSISINGMNTSIDLNIIPIITEISFANAYRNPTSSKHPLVHSWTKNAFAKGPKLYNQL